MAEHKVSRAPRIFSNNRKTSVLAVDNAVMFLNTLKNQLESEPAKNTFNMIKRELMKDKIALISCIFMILLVVVIFIVSLIYDSTEVLQTNFTLGSWNQPPSRYHWLGTDHIGRDGLLLLIFAARNALMIVALTTLISGFIGIIYGLISGYIGGFVDNVMMRIVECITVLPNLLIILVVILIDGYTIARFILVTSLLTWTSIAKTVRTKLVQEKELDYIEASRTLGTSHIKIIFHHLLPNLSTVMIASITINAVSIVGIEAGFSFLFQNFLGDPAQLINPSLGALVSTTWQIIVLRFRWWIWVPALMLIMLIMFSINNIGEMLSRAADSRQRS